MRRAPARRGRAPPDSRRSRRPPRPHRPASISAIASFIAASKRRRMRWAETSTPALTNSSRSRATSASSSGAVDLRLGEGVGVALRRVAGQPELLRRPAADGAVAARQRLEAQRLAQREELVESLLAAVELVHPRLPERSRGAALREPLRARQSRQARASFWNARARCDSASELSRGRPCFSSALISPKLRSRPSGTKIGS